VSKRTRRAKAQAWRPPWSKKPLRCLSWSKPRPITEFQPDWWRSQPISRSNLGNRLPQSRQKHPTSWSMGHSPPTRTGLHAKVVPCQGLFLARWARLNKAYTYALRSLSLVDRSSCRNRCAQGYWNRRERPWSDRDRQDDPAAPADILRRHLRFMNGRWTKCSDWR